MVRLHYHFGRSILITRFTNHTDGKKKSNFWALLWTEPISVAFSYTFITDPKKIEIYFFSTLPTYPNIFNAKLP